MTAVGQKAIIIKTASGGLDEEFLGLDVASQRTIARLSKAMGRYGEAGDGAILGEGGEFETLALDGPKSLWKKRIRIENGPPGKLDGGQAVLKIEASTLEEKNQDNEESTGTLRIPELFDEEFMRLLQATEHSSDDACPSSKDATARDGTVELSSHQSLPVADRLPRNISNETATVYTYANLTSDPHPTATPVTPSRQLVKIFLRLDHVMKQRHLSRSAINHCTLLLRDMSDFTVLNPIYAQYFSDVNPPARVTIAVGNAMPEKVNVMLSVVIDKDSVDEHGTITRAVKRQGLHVQGRSYWAPANIGPYSQAISARLPPRDMQSDTSFEVVYIAGQIPLIPASMSVYNEQGFKGQALLSLQHLWRIGRTKHVKWWTAAVGFIPASSSHPKENACIAQNIWKAIHTPPPTEADNEEDGGEDVDPWDRLNTHTSSFNDTTYRAPIPDFTALSGASMSPAVPPPCFIAQVDSLPRGVDIEWSATGLTSSSIEVNRTTTTPLDSSVHFYAFEIREKSDMEKIGGDWTNATLYAGPGLEWDARMKLKGVQWIPCLSVWGEGGKEVSGVLVGRMDDGEEVCG
jgi:diphthine-ammonia ligase